MKGNVSPSNEGKGVRPAAAKVVRAHQHRSGAYQKVRDERKHPIRGLWIRNGRYYAQVTLEDPNTGVKIVRRVPFEKAGTPVQAKVALDEMLVRRRKGQAIVQCRTPKAHRREVFVPADVRNTFFTAICLPQYSNLVFRRISFAFHSFGPFVVPD